MDKRSQKENKDGNEDVHPSRRDDAADLFHRFFREDFWPEPFGSRGWIMQPRRWFPRIDMTEIDGNLKVVTDIPGVDPDDIDIDVEGNRLRITGVTKRETGVNERLYRYERIVGEFRREFTLPYRVKSEEIKATYKNGVLTILLPKAEEERKGKVKIEWG